MKSTPTVYLVHPNPAAEGALRGALPRQIEIRYEREWAPLLADLVQANPSQDLFVCGPQLGSHSGPEVCRLVQRHQPGLPLVIVAQHPEEVSPPPGVALVSSRDAVRYLRRWARERVGSDPHLEALCS